VVASSGDATATGSVKFAIDTGYDGFEIREKHWISGTVATGFNYTVKVIPGSFITE